MTAIIRTQLESVMSEPTKSAPDQALMAYSEGLISRTQTMRRLGLRDYAALLVALGDAGLPMPLPPAHEIENQAVLFAKLWKAS